MFDFLYYAVAFLLAVGVLVTVHEFGHFWVARRLGVSVLRFSIGFGRPLWQTVTKGGTEVVVAAVPLGGYVRMLEDDGETPLTPAERGRAFNRQSVARRCAIVAAGPAFNFLFAALAYAAVFMIGVDGVRPVVDAVQAGGMGERAGFRAGDEIIAVNGKSNRSWNDRWMEMLGGALGGGELQFKVRGKNGVVEDLRVDTARLPPEARTAGLLERGLGLRVQRPPIATLLGGVEPGSPAAVAGLAKGDRIVALDQWEVAEWSALAEYVRARPGRAVAVTVARDGVLRDLNVTPAAHAVGDAVVGRLGVYPQSAPLPAEFRVTVRHGFFGAMQRGAESTFLMTSLTVQFLWKMLTLEVSPKNISGPLSIAEFAGRSARAGVDRLLLSLALISVSLGVLNLLPIPMLDGGHLLFYLVEALRGRPLSERMMLHSQKIGIALLAGLMSLAFYNDIIRLLG